MNLAYAKFIHILIYGLSLLFKQPLWFYNRGGSVEDKSAQPQEPNSRSIDISVIQRLKLIYHLCPIVTFVVLGPSTISNDRVTFNPSARALAE